MVRRRRTLRSSPVRRSSEAVTLLPINQSVEAQCHGRYNITDNLTAARPQYDGYGVRLVPWVAATTEAMFSSARPLGTTIHSCIGSVAPHGAMEANTRIRTTALSVNGFSQWDNSSADSKRGQERD